MYQYPTADQIERAAESRMDRIDEQVLSGKITTEGYERLCIALDDWVTAQHAGLPKAA